MLKGYTATGIEEGYRWITKVRFIDGDRNRVMVAFKPRASIKGITQYRTGGTTEYRRVLDGTWQVAAQTKGDPGVEHGGLEVTVKQGLNESPLLSATDKKVSKVIWDPNPELKAIELGEAITYTWKDKEGHPWKGGLYKPVNYQRGRRYPLVIQTHGFRESLFRPSGILPTAYAARALAAAGIVVLQVSEDSCSFESPGEVSCAASGYEAAASQLVSEELVDSAKIGIIGFSRTGIYVMRALTTGDLHLKAALVEDAMVLDYFSYLVWADLEGGWASHLESDTLIGAPAFGGGLQLWLKRSPGFNLDKVSAPLLLVPHNPNMLLNMWQPYAGLRYLQKPVDLVMLNTEEHVVTNPALRMASQGGSVDWFRFWLKDEEDPDPGKVEQYARWRGLRKLQEANEANAKAAKEKTAPVN